MFRFRVFRSLLTMAFAAVSLVATSADARGRDDGFQMSVINSESGKSKLQIRLGGLEGLNKLTENGDFSFEDFIENRRDFDQITLRLRFDDAWDAKPFDGRDVKLVIDVPGGRIDKPFEETGGGKEWGYSLSFGGLVKHLLREGDALIDLDVDAPPMGKTGTVDLMRVTMGPVEFLNREQDGFAVASAQIGVPIPEPQTYAMFLLGLVAVATAVRNRSAARS